MLFKFAQTVFVHFINYYYVIKYFNSQFCLGRINLPTKTINYICATLLINTDISIEIHLFYVMDPT